MCDNSARGFLVAQGIDRVARAAKLERPHLLHVLALQEHLRADALIEAFIGEDRRPMRKGTNPFCGLLDVGECDWHGVPLDVVREERSSSISVGIVSAVRCPNDMHLVSSLKINLILQRLAFDIQAIILNE